MWCMPRFYHPLIGITISENAESNWNPFGSYRTIFSFEMIQPKKDLTMNLIKNLVCEENGVTAIEYGLIAALVSVAIIAGATATGTSLNDLFQRLGDCIANPATACSLVV